MNLLVFGCGLLGVPLLFSPTAGDRAFRPAAARPKEPDGVQDLPLLLDLLAALLAAGLPLDRSLRELGAICSRSLGGSLAMVGAALGLGSEWSAAWRGILNAAPLRALVDLERSTRLLALTGAPSAVLLRAEATRLRQERQRELQRRAAALGVKLVLPMGLCALPAFMLLGVVPVLIALLPG